jgi:hypothetical protein
MLIKQRSLQDTLFKLSAIFLFFLVLSPITTRAQAVYQPYSYQFYQKFNKVQYNWESRQHTASKPIIIDSVMAPVYELLMNVESKERSTWVGRKLWNEHLIDIKGDDFTFYGDFLPDFQIGRDFSETGKTTWLNTRGFQVGGTIGEKFFFYTSAYENQGVFPTYVNDFILENNIVPGQMYGKLGTDQQDWTYASAIISYSPKNNLNFSLAYDKNFIGDGYRSMLLSDISSNSTFLKFNGTFGDVQITSIMSYMLDPKVDGNRTGNQSRWGAFQYADWNVNNRFSIGLFQSTIWAYRHNVGASNMIQVGLNTKYKAFRNATLYGQLLMTKKLSGQFGIRGYDAFKIKNLNFLAEYNFAKPYSYSDNDPLTSYNNYLQPLAHPFGANFREFVGIANYSYKKFDFSLQGNYGNYGLDPTDADNYGKNLFKPYDKNLENGDAIGQGLKTTMVYTDVKVAYILNPKYNLRLEAGAALRRESNSEWTNNSSLLTLGLRASFRNLYYDF